MKDDYEFVDDKLRAALPRSKRTNDFVTPCLIFRALSENYLDDMEPTLKLALALSEEYSSDSDGFKTAKDHFLFVLKSRRFYYWNNNLRDSAACALNSAVYHSLSGLHELDYDCCEFATELAFDLSMSPFELDKIFSKYVKGY